MLFCMPDLSDQKTSLESHRAVGQGESIPEGFSSREKRSLTIDRGLTSDIPAIRQIIGDAWLELYESHFSLGGVANDIKTYLSDESLQGMLDNPLGVMLVARDPGTLAPCGVLYGYGAEDQSTAELLYLYLSPSARGLGAGNALLQVFEQHVADHKELQLEVFASNGGAQGFYERSGFIRNGECKGVIGDATGTWHIMVKSLQQ